MDISTFRWILVFAGIAILAGIYLFGIRDKKKPPRASLNSPPKVRIRKEPVLNPGPVDESLDGDEIDDRQAELDMKLSTGDSPRIEPRFETIRSQQPADVVLPDKIVTVFLQARGNHVITGVDLLDAALKSGLVFGDHDIFHRIHEEDVQPVFSMANLTKPGAFDKTSWNTLETRGVTLFMTLPGPRNALDAWDSMLAASRRLAVLLKADLLDDAHTLFTRQRSIQIKEELREYERRKLSGS